VRKKEMELVWKNSMWGIVSMFLWAGTPMLVTLVTFFVYTLSGKVPARPIYRPAQRPCAPPPRPIPPARRATPPRRLAPLNPAPPPAWLQELKPNVAFTSLALFNVMRFPLSFLPMIINFIIESRCAQRAPARASAGRGGSGCAADGVGTAPFVYGGGCSPWRNTGDRWVRAIGIR
jgi:hypothetical protein